MRVAKVQHCSTLTKRRPPLVVKDPGLGAVPLDHSGGCVEVHPGDVVPDKLVAQHEPDQDLLLDQRLDLRQQSCPSLARIFQQEVASHFFAIVGGVGVCPKEDALQLQHARALRGVVELDQRRQRARLADVGEVCSLGVPPVSGLGLESAQRGLSKRASGVVGLHAGRTPRGADDRERDQPAWRRHALRCIAAAAAGASVARPRAADDASTNTATR